MALIKCDECGANVSDKATACPKCGNPIHASGSIPPASVSGPSVSASAIPANANASARRKLGGGLAALLVAVIAFMVYESQSTRVSTANPTTTASDATTVSHPATNAADSSTTEPAVATPASAAGPTPATINVSMDALPGWPNEQPKNVSLIDLYNDYEANEVAADNKYRGHLLMVTGSINRIAKDLMDRTYLALNLDGHIFDVNAVLASPYLPIAATLRKGQMVTLVCVGDGKVVTPDIKNCAIAVADGTRVGLNQTTASPGAAAASKIVADAPTDGQTPVVSPSDQATIEPSFDCRKAHSTPEMLICGDAELAALDVELAQLYAQAKAAAPDKREFANTTRLNWNWREQNCRDKACLVTWYADQKQRFTNIINQAPVAETGQTGAAIPAAPQQAAPTSDATSFDCSAPTYLDEKAICGDPGLAAMDMQMAAEYTAALKRTADPTKLESDQNDWHAVRRDCAADLNCIRHSYGVRIDQLRRWQG